MDKWILSRLNSLVKAVDAYLGDIRITEAGRELQRFIDDLSNWYVRRCRDRYWGKDMTPDKEAAYMTLFTVLKTLSLISAPFIPFMTEEIYQNIVRTVDKDAPESIHLCDWPAVDESFIDPQLEAHMDQVLDVVAVSYTHLDVYKRQGPGWLYRQLPGLPFRLYRPADPLWRYQHRAGNGSPIPA